MRNLFLAISNMHSFLIAAACISLWVSPQYVMAIVFGDDATYISGKTTYHGFTPTGDDDVDLDIALTGYNQSTYLTGVLVGDVSHGYTVEMEFIDNYLYNGDGADLLVWELGTPEPFHVSIYNPLTYQWTSNYRAVPVNHIAEIDFSYWDIGLDAHISRVRVSTENWNNSWVGADISTFGGVNSAPIPEPSTMLLLASGLIGLAGFRKLRRK